MQHRPSPSLFIIRHLLMLAAGLLMLSSGTASAQPGQFSFGVLTYPARGGNSESAVRAALAESQPKNLVFNVENGIKTLSEPCSDQLFMQRLSLLQGARKPLILSLAARDWTECKRANGKTAALERLHRIRELFFAEDQSFGVASITLVRQSTSAKFRSYAENARWEVGNILFATINLPANNNNYRADAGRNSEFDDRLEANRDWLQRLFTQARQRKLEGIVLFSDASPLKLPTLQAAAEAGEKRDGFAETRKKILELADRFDGQVLLVHGPHGQQSAHDASPVPAAPAIIWSGKVGTLIAPANWIEVSVQPGSSNLFAAVTQYSLDD